MKRSVLDSVLTLVVILSASAPAQQLLRQFTAVVHSDSCHVTAVYPTDPIGLGDVDGDGFADYAVYGGQTCAILSVWCVGTPCPYPAAPGLGLISGGTGQLLAGRPTVVPDVMFGIDDVNGDGLGDWVAHSRGTTTIHAGPRGQVLNSFVGTTPSGFAGDVDGDGRGDIFVWVSQQQVRLMRHDGTEIRTIALPGGLAGSALARAGDVDADGREDLIVGAPGGGVAIVFAGLDGSLLHTLRGSAGTGRFGASVAGAFDMDLDGHDDVAVAGDVEGIVFSGRTGAVISVRQTSTPATISAFGDANGDGYPDLVFSFGSSFAGESQIVSGADGRVLHSRTPSGSRGWDIRAAGDVNGDGLADFFEVNRSTSAVLYNDVVRLMAMSVAGGSNFAHEWTRGAGCEGVDGRVRSIDFRGRAHLTESIEIRLLAGPAAALTVLHIGDPVSLSLSLFGATGCTLLSAPYATVSTSTDALGFASTDLALPIDIAPIGHRFELQWAILDVGANPLGVTVSDALALRIGG